MKLYKILYSRNDKAELKWKEWLNGYPFINAQSAIKKLSLNNKDFCFKFEAE